jgi:serine/threonine protein kinase
VEKIKKLFEQQQIDDWKFLKSLSKEKQGGQSFTALVENTKDGKKGVFKILKNLKDEDIQRFKRETEYLSDPKNFHENIIEILNYSASEKTCWYITEYGLDFKTYWKLKKSELSPIELFHLAVEILRQLVSGLGVLHEDGIVHRDIKPNNIIILDNKPKLIDFGILFLPELPRLTPSNKVARNAGFSHHSTLYPNNEVRPWLDIFQLTQVFIWMLSNHPINGWYQPLDWRYVQFIEGIEETQLLKIRAFVATGSEELLSPKNASEYANLISQLFTSQSKVKTESINNDKVESILAQKEIALSEKLISKSEDHKILVSSWELYANQVYLPLLNHIEDLSRQFDSNDIPNELLHSNNFNEWIESLIKKDEEIGYVNNYPFDFYCGKREGNHLHITLINQFLGPSQLSKTPQAVKAPSGLMPFILQIGVGGNPEIVKALADFRTLFIGVARDGKIICSDSYKGLQDKNELKSYDEFIEEITEICSNEKIWKILYKNQ